MLNRNYVVLIKESKCIKKVTFPKFNELINGIVTIENLTNNVTEEAVFVDGKLNGPYRNSSGYKCYYKDNVKILDEKV